MTITNTWAVVQMDCYPEYEGLNNVVFTVHWTLNGTDAEGHYGSTYGSVSIALDPDGEYTAYDDLTQSQVIEWVKDSLGADQVAGYEASVAKQIEDQINPPVVKPQLPW